MVKKLGFAMAAAALVTSQPAWGSDATYDQERELPGYEQPSQGNEAGPAEPQRERAGQDLESPAGQGTGAGEPAVKGDDRRAEQRKQQEEDHERFLNETWSDS